MTGVRFILWQSYLHFLVFNSEFDALPLTIPVNPWEEYNDASVQ